MMHRWGWLVVVALTVTPPVAHGFRYGEPEPEDPPRRSATATGMLNRLYEAARERADKVRAQEGTTTRPMSGKEVFGSLLDYATDKLRHPPLRQVERNLLRLHRDTRRLAGEMRELRRAVAGLLTHPTDPQTAAEQREACVLEGAQPTAEDETRCVCRTHPDPDGCQFDRRLLASWTRESLELDRVWGTELLPVQGPKYTEIGK
jgi:hypothetical protein